MIGKQLTRSGSFSMLHAFALVAALGLAGWLNPTSTYSTNTVSSTSTPMTIEGGQGVVMIFKATMVRVFDCDADKGIDI